MCPIQMHIKAMEYAISQGIAITFARAEQLPCDTPICSCDRGFRDYSKCCFR